MIIDNKASADAEFTAKSHTGANPPQLPNDWKPDLAELIAYKHSYALDKSNCFVAPHIPERKLNGSIEGVALKQVKPQDVLFICDDTLFGSATDGLLLTKEKLYVKSLGRDAFSVKLEDIMSVEPSTPKPKEKEVIIRVASGRSYTMQGIISVTSARAFSEWLMAIVLVTQYNAGVSVGNNAAQSEKQVQPQSSAKSSTVLPKDRGSDSKASSAGGNSANNSAQNCDDSRNNKALSTATELSTHVRPQPPQLPKNLTLDLFTLLTHDFTPALKNSYAAPDIPERKLNGAIEGIASNKVKPNEVLLVCDDTLFGSASDGMLFTRDTVYIKAMMEDPFSIKFADIQKVDLYDRSPKEKGVKITLADGGVRNLPSLVTVINTAEAVAEWLQAVAQVAQYETALAQYTGEDQSTKLARCNLDQMPHEIQFKYMQIISNFLVSDDGVIDAREAGLFYSLLARIKLSAEERYQLRLYQSDVSKLVPTQQLVQEITANLDRLAANEIINSLVKDMINIHIQTKSSVSVYRGANNANAAESDQSYLQNPFIQRFAQDNGITVEQLKVIKQAIDADNKIFDDNVDDAGLNSALANVAAAAGAVGIPIAALYFSGSVIGLSAAGITSGLSALGLGGLFGLSGMATGIGAVILIGLGANKGIKMLTGQDERDKRARKQAMLFAVNRQLTKSINMLVEDSNVFTQELLKQMHKTQALELDVIQKEQAMTELYQRIEALAVFSQGSDLMVEDSSIVESKAYRQSLPVVMNIERLKAITDEPTKRPFYDEILKLYEATEDYNDEGQKITVYRLCSDLSNDEAEFLSQALEKLEYFSVSGLAKSGLASIKSLWN